MAAFMQVCSLSVDFNATSRAQQEPPAIKAAQSFSFEAMTNELNGMVYWMIVKRIQIHDVHSAFKRLAIIYRSLTIPGGSFANAFSFR
jgi:hypothetical protein